MIFDRDTATVRFPPERPSYPRGRVSNVKGLLKAANELSTTCYNPIEISINFKVFLSLLTPISKSNSESMWSHTIS